MFAYTHEYEPMHAPPDLKSNADKANDQLIEQMRQIASRLDAMTTPKTAHARTEQLMTSTDSAFAWLGFTDSQVDYIRLLMVVLGLGFFLSMGSKLADLLVYKLSK